MRIKTERNNMNWGFQSQKRTKSIGKHQELTDHFNYLNVENKDYIINS